MKKNVRRKGFTLVELLIVIVIIGILAGSMMMLMGSSRDKAEATRVLSDLRTIKSASLQYASDENRQFVNLDWANNDSRDRLESYIDHELEDADFDVIDGADGKTYVGATIPSVGAGQKFVDTVAGNKIKAWYSDAKITTGTTPAAQIDKNTSPKENGWYYLQLN